jgi:UDP-N-acetyl-D-mannosaminuronic acid dehydrogenase
VPPAWHHGRCTLGSTPLAVSIADPGDARLHDVHGWRLRGRCLAVRPFLATSFSYHGECRQVRMGRVRVKSGAPFDVAVIGGAGHVGAPLAIVLAKAGIRTIGIDRNESAVRQLSAGELPFLEHGAEEPLQDALGAGMLVFSTDIKAVQSVPILVVTIGTPIDEYHNPRVSAITDCVDEYLPFLSDDQTLILRSTVLPGATEYLERYLRTRGRGTRVAFCPERVVQGHAIRELQELPQLVSGTTPEAEATAASLFSRIAPSVVRLAPREAEFAKLISNAYRYIQFAAANEFHMLAERTGVDYARIRRALQVGYPRMRDLPGAGFAAGPCLMKDTMQLGSFDNMDFLLGRTATMINEGLPSFIVENLKKRRDLKDLRIGVLGMTFKADIDDIRDSLSYKLGKILRFHGASVSYSDEYAQDPTFTPAVELVETCDVIIVGVPHSAYSSLNVPARTEVIDLWGILPQRRDMAVLERSQGLRERAPA